MGEAHLLCPKSIDRGEVQWLAKETNVQKTIYINIYISCS